MLSHKIYFSLFLILGFNLKAQAEPIGIRELEKALAYDLKCMNYPPPPIKDPTNENAFYDVAIIGGGMAGLAAAAALFKEGVFNIQVFDQNPEGSEGPWVTYARMKTLRSNKNDMGPALNIPHLTFHAWYEALYGTDKWEELNKVPNTTWMEYLTWYRSVMQIPVENEAVLLSIKPHEDYFILEFKHKLVKAHKIVLATGRGGFGGPSIPKFVQSLPKSYYSHVMDPMDYTALKDKRIGVVGVGSSAFDAAAVALEKGAKNVDILMRSACIPCVNKFASLPDHCFRLGFYKLSDQWRWQVISHALICTVPPPIDTLKRVQIHKNLTIKSNITINNALLNNHQIELETNQGNLKYDYLILGTGYDINGKNQPELKEFFNHILLWQDHFAFNINRCNAKFAYFPYLGPSFEFLEKEPGQAPYLKHLYCFNYASLMSHGMLCSDIGSVSFGATRLAEGIAADFLQQQSEAYLRQLEEYNAEDFKTEEYFHIQSIFED